MKKYLLVCLLAAFKMQVYGQCACCAGAASGSAFGDINNGMLTLERHQLGAEFYSDYRVINPHHDAGQVHEHAAGTAAEEEEETLLNNMWVNSAGIRYGVSSNFMVSAQLPFTALYTEKGSDYGFGDLMMTGTYSVLKRANMNLALIGGIELPTGEQKASAFDNTIIVLGSGSWDPMAGLALSKRWNKILLNANGMYKFTTAGYAQTNYGDLSVQNISFTYMISDASCYSADSLPGKTFGLTAGAGYYGEWMESIVEEGVKDVNSGYYLGYATASMKLSFKKWSMPFTFSLPVIQHMNGDQHDAGNRYRLGLVKTF